MILHAVTANRLRDGAVVYLGPRGWAETIADAVLAPDAAPLLARAAEPPNQAIITGLYAIAVEGGDGDPRPVELRERIRALGPICHPQFARPA